MDSTSTSIEKQLQYFRDHKDTANWMEVYHLKLPEDFIREFKDYLDLNQIQAHQDLNWDFVRELWKQFDVNILYILTYQTQNNIHLLEMMENANYR